MTSFRLARTPLGLVPLERARVETGDGREVRRPHAPELAAGVHVNAGVPEQSAKRLRAAVAG